jgi:hypothetical protein
MAVGFRLVKEANETVYKKLRIASQAYTLGDLAMLDTVADSIDVVPATSSTTTTNVYAVAMETVASSATEALFCLVNAQQEWSVDSTNTPTADDNYQKMLIGANAHTVNNTHTNNTTDEAVFLQTGVVGAASGKRIVGNILKVANVTA